MGEFRGTNPHELTLADRQKAAAVTNAKRRAQREAAEKMALEKLATLRVLAWTKLEGLLDADSEQVQATAVREILDRDLGKPGQPLELSGPDGGQIEVEVDHDYGNLVDKLEQAGIITRGPAASG